MNFRAPNLFAKKIAETPFPLVTARASDFFIGVGKDGQLLRFLTVNVLNQYLWEGQLQFWL